MVVLTVGSDPGDPGSGPTGIGLLLPGIPAALLPFETLIPDLPIYTGFRYFLGLFRRVGSFRWFRCVVKYPEFGLAQPY